ncbi:MAG: hypothetical protein LQ350_000642 [Teloschistes chrysophthalmus]|nr:MAG: hypothetical protein LQ350_000642 [Niorma chrysophthalma]
MSESEAYTEFCNLPSPNSIGNDDLADYYVPDARLRHQDCRPWDRPEPDSDSSDGSIIMPEWYRMDGFQICGILYDITFAIFWGKMTFSFGDLGHFWKFMSRLSPKQKRTIRSIDITAPSQTYDFPSYPNLLLPFTEFNINSLTGMETLDNFNLALHSSWFPDDRYHTAPKESIGEMDLRNRLGSQILQLEVVDIERLGVIIFDNEYDFPHDALRLIGPSFRERFVHRLTVHEKKTLAEIVRRILKAPKPERQAMLKRQQQINETEKLLQELRDAQNVEWQQQRERVWASIDKDKK